MPKEVKKHCANYISTKTGISLRFKRWLEIISDKEFEIELCMTAPSRWGRVIARFDEYVAAGILAPIQK